MYLTCPRCGSLSFERLKSHSHCCLCNFSPAFELEEWDWRESLQELRSLTTIPPKELVALPKQNNTRSYECKR